MILDTWFHTTHVGCGKKHSSNPGIRSRNAGTFDGRNKSIIFISFRRYPSVNNFGKLEHCANGTVKKFVELSRKIQNFWQRIFPNHLHLMDRRLIPYSIHDSPHCKHDVWLRLRASWENPSSSFNCQEFWFAKMNCQEFSWTVNNPIGLPRKYLDCQEKNKTFDTS